MHLVKAPCADHLTRHDPQSTRKDPDQVPAPLHGAPCDPEKKISSFAGVHRFHAECQETPPGSKQL